MEITIHSSFLPHLDPEASLAFYRDVLGFEVRLDVGYGDMRWITVGPPDQPSTAIVLHPPGVGHDMSEEEREQAVRALAQEIPSEKEGLWNWDVKWDYLDEVVIREKLRPFVEKKLVEYLGVQEQLLIEVVEEHLRKHNKPNELVEELAEVRIAFLS